MKENELKKIIKTKNKEINWYLPDNNSIDWTILPPHEEGDEYKISVQISSLNIHESYSSYDPILSIGLLSNRVIAHIERRNSLKIAS